MNGLLYESRRFRHTQTVAKNSIFVQITHVRRHRKADGTENQKKILRAIYYLIISVGVCKTVPNGQKLRVLNFRIIQS